jgi:hypothetical protein
MAPPVTAAMIGGNLGSVGAAAAVPLVLAAAARTLRPGGGPAWWALAAALLLGVACEPGLLPVAAVGLTAAAVAVGRRGWRAALARRVAGALVVAAAPLLPAMGIAARGGLSGMIELLVDQPDRSGTDAGAFGVLALGCVLAAGLGGWAARAPVAACWLVALGGWVTGQDPLAAAGLTASVAVAVAARLDERTWPGRTRTGLASAVAVAAVLIAGPGTLFARAGGWLGTPPGPASWSSPDGPAAASTVAGVAPPAGMAPRSGTGRTLVLRPSAGGVTYALAGGRGPTLPDVVGVPAAPARCFLAGVVADLTAGGGWGVSALPALGVDAVFVPAPGAAATPVAASSTAADGGAAFAGMADGGALVTALDAADGLERDQPRPDGYYWRLAPGAAAGPRLLPPGLAVLAGSLDRGPGDGSSVARALDAVARRLPSGPGVPLATAVAGPQPARASDVTTVRVSLPAGPAGRLLVLPGPADPGWHATLAGRALTPLAAWGWAQAFQVPAGPGGEARIRFDSGPHRRLVLAEAAVVGAVTVAGGVRGAAALGLLPLTGLGRRRREPSP